jgi:hypothetical protein
VDVAAEHANSIIAKLSRTRIRNQKVKVKEASLNAPTAGEAGEPAQ